MPSAIAAVRILAFTGEVLALRWEQVEIPGDCLRLPTSKTGKVIHLNGPALAVLADLARRKAGNP